VLPRFAISILRLLAAPGGFLLGGASAALWPDGGLNAVNVIHADGTAAHYSATANTNTARGEALVNAFSAHRDGDEIRVGPGSYDVPCGALLLKDARLIGTAHSLVRARDNTATHEHGDAIVGSLSPAKKKHCAVRGIRFDCNLQNQNYASAVVAAVSFLGGGSIEDCSAINWGSKGVENFVFIIGCQPGYGGLDSPRILRCKVEHPAPISHSQVVTAFDIWSDAPGSHITRDWVRQAEIAWCETHDITTGSGVGQPMAFHMITPGTWTGGSIHDNRAWNLYGSGVDPYKDNTFIYQDSFSARGVSLTANTGQNICQGIFLNMTDPTLSVDGWRITGNRFTINNTGNRLAIAQGLGSIYSGWIITRNNMNSPAGYALVLNSGSGYVIAGNTFEGKVATHNANVSHWRNNRDPDKRSVRPPPDR
jgi:hypothetical protein